MGKIKSKSIRKATKTLIKEDIQFSENFEKNKKMLESLMLSRKLRNQMAGLLAKIKKREKNRLTLNKQ